jgi:hypothetical protein
MEKVQVIVLRPNSSLSSACGRGPPGGGGCCSTKAMKKSRKIWGNLKENSVRP